MPAHRLWMKSGTSGRAVDFEEYGVPAVEVKCCLDVAALDDSLVRKFPLPPDCLKIQCSFQCDAPFCFAVRERGRLRLICQPGLSPFLQR